MTLSHARFTMSHTTRTQPMTSTSPLFLTLDGYMLKKKKHLRTFIQIQRGVSFFVLLLLLLLGGLFGGGSQIDKANDTLESNKQVFRNMKGGEIKLKKDQGGHQFDWSTCIVITGHVHVFLCRSHPSMGLECFARGGGGECFEEMQRKASLSASRRAWQWDTRFLKAIEI